MKLNCVPGDVARVIDDEDSRLCGLVDRFVRVKDLYIYYGQQMWHLEEGPISTADGIVVGIADAILRPIRDSDGEDETLRFAGKPANYKGKVVTAKPVVLEPL